MPRKNKARRNSLIALAICIGIGVIVYLAINFLKFWGVWNNPIIKIW